MQKKVLQYNTYNFFLWSWCELWSAPKIRPLLLSLFLLMTVSRTRVSWEMKPPLTWRGCTVPHFQYWLEALRTADFLDVDVFFFGPKPLRIKKKEKKAVKNKNTPLCSPLSLIHLLHPQPSITASMSSSKRKVTLEHVKADEGVEGPFLGNFFGTIFHYPLSRLDVQNKATK